MRHGVPALTWLTAITSVMVIAFVLPPGIGEEPEVETTGATASRSYREGELLVRFKTQLSEAEVTARLGRHGVTSVRRFQITSRPDSPNNRLYLVQFTNDTHIPETCTNLAARDDVELAHPNFIHRKAQNPPDDPYFHFQWGHQNTGTITPDAYPGLRGPDPRTAGADMATPEADEAIAANGWTPSEVIVGVIDTGVGASHEDLASIVLPGHDFLDDDADPDDEDGHGTHVAGFIAGITNNGKGISGVAPNAKIMPLRFLGPDGGDTADAIDAIDYGVANGAKVLNNSWGGGGYEAALKTAIQDAHAAGVLFIAAAGNDGTDNDATPHYPSDYDVPNVISVAASTPWGSLADFSNFGPQTVHLAAPGDEIISTTPAHLGPEYSFDFEHPDWLGYSSWGGTSMATPAVSGAAALVYGLGAELWPATWLTMTPSEKVVAVRDRVLAGTEPWPDLGGRVSTGGHLNLLNLVEVDSHPPDPCTDLQPVNIGTRFVTFRVTASGDDGADGRASYYDLRHAEPPLWTTFDEATPTRNGLRPRDPGMWDYITATGLQPATDYQFQLRVVDNVGNASGLSVPLITSILPAMELYYDDMEAGPGGWTTESNQPVLWQQTTDQAHSPAFSWTDSAGGPYPGDLDSSLVSPVIDLTGSGSARLEFWQMYELEDGIDHGYIEATANGIDWRTLHTVTGVSPLWTPASLDLTGYAGGTVQIRFRIQTDAAVHLDGWYIDDVVVHSSTPAPDLLLFEDTFDALHNWDPGLGDWGLESGGLSDSPGGDYPTHNVSSVRLIHPLHLETMQAAVLSFDFDTMDYEDGYDFLYLQLSTDGEMWRSIRRWTGTQPPHREGIDLSEYAGYPEIWLRFLLSTDRKNPAAGAIIDNLRVEAISMPDGDNDGVVDLFDCEPTDPGSFAPPAEIQNLRWQPGGITLEWDDEAPNCGPGVRYHVLRGRLDELPPGSGSADEICLDPALAPPFIEDGTEPDPEQGLYYLVRATNACGTSTWGFRSTGDERISFVCPVPSGFSADQWQWKGSAW